MPSSQILHGDCIEVLKTLEPESVDSLVTDPPAGISFMGKDWDSGKEFVGRMTEAYQECLRVLKPGAHALVWAIPRTSHWTATALEDAGFEIRDVITHLFGSGFPKSMNISIAIDKQAGAMGARGKAFVTAGAGERKDIQDTSGWEKDPGHEGITPEAKEWQGWGTALKPASEHWILCRKPLSEKTVAANVLKYGTGGLNIDGTRIGYTSEKDAKEGRSERKTVSKGQFAGMKKESDEYDRSDRSQIRGRFPANLVLSHNPDCVEVGVTVASFECTPGCAVAALDEQSLAGGMHSAGKARPKQLHKGDFGIGEHGGRERLADNRFGDSGGASRFFYCTKASKSERNAGLDGITCTHPTVKPLKLMRYLIRLITPPGGTVLDPFAGSGSTGVAALQEGFRFIGIEKEEEYLEIAEARMEAVCLRT